MLTELLYVSLGVVIGVVIGRRGRRVGQPQQHADVSQHRTGQSRQVVECTACHDSFANRNQAEEHLADDHGMALTEAEAEDVLEIDYFEYQ